jgi:hypothetical protein
MHLAGRSTLSNVALLEWLLDVISSNAIPVMQVICIADGKQEGYRIEDLLIKSLLNRGENLLNMDPVEVNIRRGQSIHEAAMARVDFVAIWPRPEEVNRRISAALTGRVFSESHLANMRAAALESWKKRREREGVITNTCPIGCTCRKHRSLDPEFLRRRGELIREALRLRKERLENGGRA